MKKKFQSKHIPLAQHHHQNDNMRTILPGKVIEPDTSIVERAYKYDTSLVDGMYFEHEEGDVNHNWGVI